MRAHHPQLPILVLSMHDETIYAERMLSAGANGYIMKQAASEQFLVSLRRVLDGGIYVSEAVGNNMIQKFAAGGTYISANPIDRLSNRELQILHMIGKGMSTRETAHSLNLSIKTVESHRQRIKRKLNLTTGTQLVQYAVNWFTGREGAEAPSRRRNPRPRAAAAPNPTSDRPLGAAARLGGHVLHACGQIHRLPADIALDGAGHTPPFDPAAVRLHAQLRIQGRPPLEVGADRGQQCLPGTLRQVRPKVLEPRVLDRRRPLQSLVEPIAEPGGAFPKHQSPQPVGAARRCARGRCGIVARR